MTWNSQINKPSQDYSLLVLLPVASFSQFRALEGLFLAYTALFNGPYLSSCLKPCFRNFRDAGHHQVGSTNTIKNK